MLMLMFQNGLLETFIPEILMVLGYVLCLFTTVYKPDNSVVDQTQIVTLDLCSNYHKISYSKLTYSHTYSDFQTNIDYVPMTFQSIPHFIEKSINNTSESNYFESDGLCYVDFSRPPPAFIS